MISLLTNSLCAQHCTFLNSEGISISQKFVDHVFLFTHTWNQAPFTWKILMAWNFICNHNFYVVIHYLQKITKVRYLPKAYYRLPPKSCHHFRTKSNTLLKRPHHLVPHLHFWRNLLSQYFSVHFLSVLPKAAINRK